MYTQHCTNKNTVINKHVETIIFSQIFFQTDMVFDSAFMSKSFQIC